MKKIVLLLIASLATSVLLGQGNRVYVSADTIKLPINSSVLVKADINGLALSNFRLAEEATVEEAMNVMKELREFKKENIVSDELELKFCNADFFGSSCIVLTTVHHFDKSIFFKAKIRAKGKESYVETSIVEKIPNIFSIEEWRDDIEDIVLYDFRMAKE